MVLKIIVWSNIIPHAGGTERQMEEVEDLQLCMEINWGNMVNRGVSSYQLGCRVLK